MAQSKKTGNVSGGRATKGTSASKESKSPVACTTPSKRIKLRVTVTDPNKPTYYRIGRTFHRGKSVDLDAESLTESQIKAISEDRELKVVPVEVK